MHGQLNVIAFAWRDDQRVTDHGALPWDNAANMFPGARGCVRVQDGYSRSRAGTYETSWGRASANAASQVWDNHAGAITTG